MRNTEAEPPPIEPGAVSIQWLADPGLCTVCGEVVGSGPVGYSTDEPAGPRCDVCLLKEDKGLGMLLWLVLVARELARQATGTKNPADADQCLLVLMAFAKMFDQDAEWPHREAVALDLVAELRERLARIPWPATVLEVTSEAS